MIYRDEILVSRETRREVVTYVRYGTCKENQQFQNNNNNDNNNNNNNSNSNNNDNDNNNNNNKVCMSLI